MMWHHRQSDGGEGWRQIRFGVAILPAKEQRGSPTGGGSYIFKSASPEQQKVAVKFIQWMTAPDRAAEWSIKTGYVAVSPAAYRTPAMEIRQEFPAAIVAREAIMPCRNCPCMRTAASTNSSTTPCNGSNRRAEAAGVLVRRNRPMRAEGI